MKDIQAIFFDLGKTLIYPQNDWPPVLADSVQALTQTLIDNHVDIDAHRFAQEFHLRLDQYYRRREKSLREESTFNMLQDLIKEKGSRNAPDPVLRTALNAKYSVTQQNWYIEPDAHATLQTLKKKGFKLALLSNAGDDADVQALLNQHNLKDYFNFIRTSAACGYRKPHPFMFQEAMQALRLHAKDCAMIGDTLNADILGANKLGIYSVWINRRVSASVGEIKQYAPCATIESLSELPDLINNL